MKFVTEEEVCEECPIYGETGTDHCFQDAHRLAIEALEKQSKLERVIERLEANSFWTEATFDEDGYCNDDSEKVIGLSVAIEIIRQELM